MENYFESLWQVLYDHGASEKKKEGTQRFWNTLTPVQQKTAFTTITQKLKEGKFVQFDPIRAIRENIRDFRGAAEPKDYNGTPELESVRDHSRIACYNGHWGIYTFEDIKLFNLQTKD